MAKTFYATSIYLLYATIILSLALNFLTRNPRSERTLHRRRIENWLLGLAIVSMSISTILLLTAMLIFGY